MRGIKNSRKIVVFIPATILITVFLAASPVTIINTAFAKIYTDWGDCRDDHGQTWCEYYFQITGFDKCSNDASQGIGQSQSSEQNSQVVSGGDSINSGNNINIQGQGNSGNDAMGQQ